MHTNGSAGFITRRACINWIMLVYFASGACSLIDEVVWVRLLKLTLGNTVYASSIVVSVFMGGLALGALIMGRYCDSVKKRLRLYALLETLVTVSALSLPWALKLADTVYVWFYRAYHPANALLLFVQVLISAAILLVPSMLMGSTLPLLGRFVTSLEKEAGHLVGRLYALNTLGAAVGCFLAGFVLIRAVGVMGTLYIAAALNLLVAFGGWFLSRFSGVTVDEQPETSELKAGEAVVTKTADARFYVLFIAFFMSGLISIGYELLWMRSIVHLLGGFTYVFSAVLTVYLLGNVIGAGIGSALVRKLKNPSAGFAVTLSLLGLYGVFYLPLLVFWTSEGMQYINLHIVGGFLPFSHYLVKPIAQSLCLFLLPAVIMGIGFPIALQAWANHMHKVGRSTGTAYGANTIGAVIGGIVTGFVLIPLLGVQISISILGLIGAWIAGIMSLVFARRSVPAVRWILVILAVILTVFTIRNPSDQFKKIVKTNIAMPGLELVTMQQGLTTTVSVHRDSSRGTLYMYASGQSIAGENYTARGDQKMMGHLGVLLNSNSKKVLSVGFGSGETTACLARHKLQRVDCVEIAPEVVKVALEFFTNINLGDRLDEEVNMIFMDAKNYIHLTDNKYDVIVNDSIHPRLFAENASLYTKEYFESAKEHLNDNGIIISWLPTYSMPISVFDSIIGTLLEVCPHVTLWYLTPNPAPLVLIIGSEKQQYFSPRHIENEFSKEGVRSSLEAINIRNNLDVLSCYICDENDLKRLVTNFTVNSDYFPFVEFVTDEQTNLLQIFRRYVMDVRSESIYRHIDWTGFSDRQKDKWLKDYKHLYKALDYLLPLFPMPDSPPSELSRFKASMEGLRQLPNNPVLMNTKADAERRIFAGVKKLVSSGRIDAVEALSEEILRQYPESSLGWLITSNVMMEKGQRDKGLAFAQRAVSIAPDNTNARFNLGFVLYTLGYLERAVTECEEALRLAGRPDEVDKYNQAKMLEFLARVYAAAGRFPEAITTAEKALDAALSSGQQDFAEYIRGNLRSFKQSSGAERQP